MARPIAPTPTLKGKAIVDFFVRMEKGEKESQAERERVFKNAEKLKKCLPKDF